MCERLGDGKKLSIFGEEGADIGRIFSLFGSGGIKPEDLPPDYSVSGDGTIRVDVDEESLQSLDDLAEEQTGQRPHGTPHAPSDAGQS